MNKTTRLVGAVALAACAAGIHAQAAYPSKPIRLVVGFAPAGAPDAGA